MIRIFVIKKLCEPCFPPSYHLFDYFVSCVHEVLTTYFKSLLDENNLKDQEFFILLSWIDTYKSPDFMGSPSLHVDMSKLPDLLDENYYMKTVNGHLDFTIKRTTFMFQNVLDKNYIEWQSNVQPQLYDGNYESSLPNDLNSMLTQQVTHYLTQFC